MPAFATAQTEPVVALPERVTGIDALVVPLPAGAAGRVDLVDAEEQQAAWVFTADSVVDGALAVDLAAPDEGVQPVNGPAQLTVTSGDITLVTGTVMIDMDPAASTLTAKARGADAVLSWQPVTGPGTVRYRLERRAGDGAWLELIERNDVGYTDRILAPGRYRYRLTSFVAGVAHEENTSAASVATVRIAAPAPTAEPPPSEEPETQQPQTPKPPAPQPPTRSRPRDVAATGDISETFSPPDSAGRQRRQKLAPAPDVEGLRAGTRRPGSAVAPRFADAAAPASPAAAPTVAPRPAPAPMAMPPAGSLVLDSAAAGSGHPALVGVAAALLLLLVAAQTAVGAALRRRATPEDGRP